mgnify:CR=1 FL=1
MTDGLLITALGMGVVFVGLILTSLLIVSFSVVPRLLKGRAPAAAPEAPPASAPGGVPPADARVIAVITAALEIERRLRGLETGGRLTIQRTS